HATATTSGTVTKVRFFVNGALMAEDSTAPYVARWPARVGTRDVVARAVGPLESAVSEALDYSVESAPVGAESGLADGFALETVQNGLVLPTSAAPLPSGAVLVTEKAGCVQVLEPLTGGGYAPPRLVLDLSEEVEDSVDAGLIGIAASPRIATDG